MEIEKVTITPALQWIPSDDKPDEDCTILELWSRFHNEIADYQGFHNKSQTIREYTSALHTIEESLKKQKATEMTAVDCLDAVMSVTTYDRDGKTVAYKESSMGKRWAAMRDTFRYCENRFICANPIWKAPWELLKVQPRDVWKKSKDVLMAALRKDSMRRALKLQYITLPIEQKIVRKAMKNLMGPVDQRDGRWMGMLCYLYLGVRPSEGRGLRFGDFRQFGSHPGHWYCNICRTATAAGEFNAKGKNRNYIRRIPVHPELQTILAAYKKLLLNELECPEGELEAIPLICTGANFRKPCTSLQLMRFVKSQLSSIFGEEELDTLFALSYTNSSDAEDPANTYESSADGAANRDFSTRIFRRNYITKAYAETTLSESEIRAIVGHRQKDSHVDYSEETVFSWWKALSHRLICPEYHAQITSTVDSCTALHQTAAGIHDVVLQKDVASEGLQVVITMLGDAAGSDLQIVIQGRLPEGVTVTCKQNHFLWDNGNQGRIITDASHWQLEPQNQ